jgi:hypothetical protein
MDKVTIQEIATEIVARLPYGDRYWLFLLVNVIVMALVGVLAVLGTSYLRTRGQNLATKHDFDELQKQLRANTELVETIKSEVGQKDWAQRQWTNLRRTKLEELVEKMHDCEAFLDQLRRRAVKGELEMGERDPMGPLQTIGDLYFLELRSEVYRFASKWRELAMMGMDHALAVSAMGAEPDAYRAAHKIFREQWASGYKQLLEARHELTTAARHLLVSIMGVEEEEP